jgi:GT2 family glycosyltransferase
MKQKKEVNICVPTLNRYDMLTYMIISLKESTVPVDRVHIIDNGNRINLKPILKHDIKIRAVAFGHNIGVAASWNWFCENVNEHRIICNDDVEFYPDTIEKMIDAYDENFLTYPNGIPSANSFSCYMLPDKIYSDVGGFDINISPNYAYFEDNDYHRRMRVKGYDIKGIPDCQLGHKGSSTLKFLPKEYGHHERFRIAQKNYVKKWGGMPGKEKFNTPYDR